MKPINYRAVAISLAFVLVCEIGSGQSTTDSMVVVLRNDAVIIGQVTQTDDGISVRTETGSTAVFRLNQVAFLAESMDAAYVQLLNSADLSQPKDVRRVFDWSLRNGLLDRSAEIVRKVQSQNIDQAEVNMLRRRLEAAILDSQNSLLKRPQSNGASSNSDLRPTTQKQIELAIDSLPRGAEGFFNQQIHAKLISGCAAAKCHGRDHESLSLWHDGIGVAAPHGYTRRNLHEILQWIDRDDPAGSKLLKMATTAHGGQATPTFAANDKSFQLLQYWSYAISRHPEEYLSDVLGQPETTTSAATPAAPPLTSSSERIVAQVGFVEDSVEPIAPQQSAGKPAAADNPSIVDVCDPMLFNRLHHPNRDN